MKIIVLHPTGNRNVRAVLTALDHEGMLAEFDTSISVTSNASWLKVLPNNIRTEFLRRSFDLPKNKIHANPFLEVARILLPKMKLPNLVRHEYGWASVDAVYKNLDVSTSKRLDNLTSKNLVHGVYAYEDGALATFERAKKLGLKCIYELPIAYWELGRSLMIEEAERLPLWADTLGGGIKDSQKKLDRKTRELELADIVITPGKFVVDSLPAWASKKALVIAPFGSPDIVEKMVNSTPKKNDVRRPLRVLFVGSMGQRKGLADLFTAIKLLNNDAIELVVLGSLQAPMEFYRSELTRFTYELGRPHEAVLGLMRSCDVFCLPSIVEGRALVIQEAMSQGLPIIITPNTGGADLIIEGHTGFLVPIRSPEIIAEKICWFNNNRLKIPEMGRSAQEHAATYTWQSYGAKIINELKKNFSSNH